MSNVNVFDNKHMLLLVLRFVNNKKNKLLNLSAGIVLPSQTYVTEVMMVNYSLYLT